MNEKMKDLTLVDVENDELCNGKGINGKYENGHDVESTDKKVVNVVSNKKQDRNIRGEGRNNKNVQKNNHRKEGGFINSFSATASKVTGVRTIIPTKPTGKQPEVTANETNPKPLKKESSPIIRRVKDDENRTLEREKPHLNKEKISRRENPVRNDIVERNKRDNPSEVSKSVAEFKTPKEMSIASTRNVSKEKQEFLPRSNGDQFHMESHHPKDGSNYMGRHKGYTRLVENPHEAYPMSMDQQHTVYTGPARGSRPVIYQTHTFPPSPSTPPQLHQPVPPYTWPMPLSQPHHMVHQPGMQMQHQQNLPPVPVPPPLLQPVRSFRKNGDNGDMVECVSHLICSGLEEPNDRLIFKIVSTLGIEKSLELYESVRAVQLKGGMFVRDFSRLRTPGGVYLHLIQNTSTIPRSTLNEIFYNTTQTRGYFQR